MSPLKYINGLPRTLKKAYQNNPRLNDDHRYESKRGWVKPLFYGFAITYFVAIAVISVATAGYQFVPIITTSWVDTNTFWFEKFLPISYRPQTRICGGHSFRIGDSSAPPTSAFLMFRYQHGEPVFVLLHSKRLSRRSGRSAIGRTHLRERRLDKLFRQQFSDKPAPERFCDRRGDISSRLIP
jgi:hypothetical protein